MLFMQQQAIGLSEVTLTNPKRAQTPGSKSSARLQRCVMELGKSISLFERGIEL
jgi:hypothetical protein